MNGPILLVTLCDMVAWIGTGTNMYAIYLLLYLPMTTLSISYMKKVKYKRCWFTKNVHVLIKKCDVLYYCISF